MNGHSLFFGNGLIRGPRFCFDKPNPDVPPPGGPNPPAPAPDNAKDMADLKAANEALMKRLEALEKGKPDPKDDKSLEEKVRLQREAEEKTGQDAKRLSSAIKFIMSAKEWVKTNESLLPKSIPALFAQAERENYASDIEKDGALKSGIISEFFAIQENLDLLTDSQKNSIEQFRKLTNTVKQERAQQVYDDVFEPTFEQKKRIEKAKQVSKGGVSTDNSQDAYKQKMIEAAKKRLSK